MKKVVKWILTGIVAALAAAAGIYYAVKPLEVETVSLTPSLANLYFTEKGICVPENVTDVYPTVSGKIISVSVSEGSAVKKGDVICTIDDSDFKTQILQVESDIKSLEAQSGNVALEEQKQKDSLISDRNNLYGQIKALEAEQSNSSLLTADVRKAKDEQIRLQNIIIEQSERDLERARQDYDRFSALLSAGGISQNEFDAVQKALDAAQTALDRERQQLIVIESGDDAQDMDAFYTGRRQSLEAQIAGINTSLSKSYTAQSRQYYAALIESSRATLSRLQKQVADCVVTAPADGVVTALYCVKTNVAGPQSSVCTITSSGGETVEVYVSTNDIDSVHVGDAVSLILIRREGDKTVPGRVTEIGSEAIVKLSALGVEERRVKVNVAPDFQTEDIKTGYDMDVKFDVYHEEGKLIVPKTALFKVDDKDTVWIIRDNQATKVSVVKGVELRADYVIEDGLSAGDAVIADAALEGLKEGTRVKGLAE